MTAKKRSLLDRMADNPRDDWTIEDVQKLCDHHDIEFRQGAGSHSVVSSPYLRDSFTVPARKPIKPRYIKDLVGYVWAHQHHANRRKEDNDG